MTQDAFRSQRELLAIIRTANPHQLGGTADKWSKCADVARQAADYVQERLTQLTAAEGWTGPASRAYAARITKDVIGPLRTFASNASTIGESVRTLSTEVSAAVNQALANPVPWDEQTRWRVEQKPVERGWFSYVDEFVTGADEAYEQAQSNAPYQIKTGAGIVRKEIPKPVWQQTILAVGAPVVPAVYQASGVSVSSEVVRFDALMEYQDMNTAQRQSLQANTERVNTYLANMLPVDSDGNVGGPAELPTSPSTSGSGSGAGGSGSGSPWATPTTSVPSVPTAAAPVVGGDLAGPTNGVPVGTGSAGISAGSIGSLGGVGGSMPGYSGGGGAGSGSTSAWGVGSIGAGALGGAGSTAARPGVTGTSAAGSGGMMAPMMGGGAGGRGGGASLSKRARSVSGAGGFAAGATGAMPGGAGGGFGATGSNASFNMGPAGRGGVNVGSVGPVGNAQMGGAGGTGMAGAPMAQRKRDEEQESDLEQMYLDEDRSIWDTSTAVPPGHIR